MNSEATLTTTTDRIRFIRARIAERLLLSFSEEIYAEEQEALGNLDIALEARVRAANQRLVAATQENTLATLFP